MELPNAAVTVIALVVGLATFIGVVRTWMRIRNKHLGGFDPDATKSKIEAGVVLAVALASSGLAFYGLLVLLA